LLFLPLIETRRPIDGFCGLDWFRISIKTMFNRDI